MKSDAETYISHFESFSEREPTFHCVSEPGEWPPLHVIRFSDEPAAGESIGITYGLSLVEHSQWKHRRAELIITVESIDIAWSLTVGEMAYRLRGKCPFCYGNTIRFGTQIADESEMSAFVVFAPTVIGKEYRTVSQTGYDIHIAQMYPIYESELAVIEEKGLEYFFSRPGSFFANVRRQPIQ